MSTFIRKVLLIYRNLKLSSDISSPPIGSSLEIALSKFIKEKGNLYFYYNIKF